MRKLKAISLLTALLCTVFSVLVANAMGFDAETAYKSVAVIYSGNAMGSGFAVSGSKIITNAHVIDDVNKVSVSLYQDGATYKAAVVAIDRTVDLAVLEISGVTLPYLAIADYNDLKTGADLYAIGAPEDLQYSLTKGILSSKDRVVDGYTYIQTDAPINSGNSGGPLLNDSGSVIGVNTLKILNSDGIGLAIPMTVVSEFLVAHSIGISEQSDVINTLAAKADTIIADATASPAAGTDSSGEIAVLKQQNAVLVILLIIFIIATVVLMSLLILAGIRRRRNPIRKDTFDFDIELREDGNGFEKTNGKRK